MKIQRVGTQPSAKGPEEYFTSSVRVDMMFKAEEPGRSSAGHVTFTGSAHSVAHPSSRTGNPHYFWLRLGAA